MTMYKGGYFFPGHSVDSAGSMSLPCDIFALQISFICIRHVMLIIEIQLFMIKHMHIP